MHAEHPHDPAEEPDTVLGLQVAFSAVAGCVVTVVWVLTGSAEFWAGWAWLGLVALLAVHVLVRYAVRAPAGGRRDYRVALGALAIVAAIQPVVWLLGGQGPFWPAWPLLAIAAIAATLAAIVHRRRLPWVRAQAALEARVDVLTRTRSGALDVQAQQLRRIERDLHDGAQVRLVALAMRLGRAEARLDDAGDPVTRDLVRGAREEATAAIAELRDLARGIAPPVLADRGLAAAAEALGRRSGSPVTVSARLDDRPAPVVESAAYFVVAEALANAAKHVPGAPVSVALTTAEHRLIVEVLDEGGGGADASGSGLTGLRHRVEALDGTLVVRDVPATGTLVRAELPCVP
ncbi:sensor histidine kinase [Patulibacter americanus]|uniref:sensor histidine kinase n=1 Tax=Patulibacter americanus TaxID=588672 RepID=UPI000417651E|nr:histidine kinase [Patulibacter americanus]